ncbi:MAG: GTPase Era [Acidimicrobiia bacterium]
MSRFGYVAIAGRPNTGKSTLLNTVAGQKLSIVSNVPQTTRHPVRFVINLGDSQIALVDLPGFAKPKTLVGKRLNEAVSGWVADSDACILLVDAAAGVGRGDLYLARTILTTQVPAVCAVNKVDVASKAEIALALEKMREVSEECEASGGKAFVDFVPISAKTGSGIRTLLDTVASILPESDHLYSGEESLGLGDDNELHRRIAEIIREKLIRNAKEELPYSIAVIVEDINVREAKKTGEVETESDQTGTQYGRSRELIEISVKILVERESQKAIVIGSKGEALKKAGTEARLELEALLGSRVFLDLRVVVEKNWQKNPKILDKLGL